MQLIYNITEIEEENMKILLNVLGIVVLLGALYFFSSNKKLIDKKMILKALVLQFVLAFLLVKFPLGKAIIEKVSDVVTNILGYGAEGISFVFGSLSDSSGAPTGSIFGIQVLGNIIFISSLVAALYYLGVIGAVVKGVGGAIGKVLGTSRGKFCCYCKYVPWTNRITNISK